MADLAVWQRTIVDEEGNVIPGAEIEVRREEDDSLATLYADRAGETPLANPLAADMSGFVRFFARGDAYTITAVGAGSTRTWRFDPTGRLQEFDRVSEALVADDAADLLSARSNLGTFSTVADVQNSHIPAVLESIRTFGRNAPGDGPSLDLVRGSEAPGAVQSADGQWWEDVGYNDIVVRIPSQFRTMQHAVDHYNRLPVRRGARITLLLESGYEIPLAYAIPWSFEGTTERACALFVQDGDFSHFIIRSEDPIVQVVEDFHGEIIVGRRASMPWLGTIIDKRGTNGQGYEVGMQSQGWIEEGCGVINAGGINVRMRGPSVLTAVNAVLTGGGQGLNINHGGRAYLNGADFSGCTEAIRCSDAMIECTGATFDDCGQVALLQGAFNASFLQASMRNCGLGFDVNGTGLLTDQDIQWAGTTTQMRLRVQSSVMTSYKGVITNVGNSDLDVDHLGAASLHSLFRNGHVSMDLFSGEGNESRIAFGTLLNPANGRISYSDALRRFDIRVDGSNVFQFRDNTLCPSVDAGAASGNSNNRWTTVYAVNGTIATSDEREKDVLGPIPDVVLDAWSEVEFMHFRWLASIEQKGDQARKHIGVLAQRIDEAFARHGLDAREWGLFGYDQWEDEFAPEEGPDGEPTGELVQVQTAGDRYSIRADQCLFLEAALMRREMKALRQ